MNFYIDTCKMLLHSFLAWVMTWYHCNLLFFFEHFKHENQFSVQTKHDNKTNWLLWKRLYISLYSVRVILKHKELCDALFSSVGKTCLLNVNSTKTSNLYVISIVYSWNEHLKWNWQNAHCSQSVDSTSNSYLSYFILDFWIKKLFISFSSLNLIFSMKIGMSSSDSIQQEQTK